MASLFTAPQFDGGTGITPEDGLQLFFFEEGTSTPKDTFTTEALNIANSNPVISDADGVFPEIWMAESSRYKVRLWDKNDVLVGFGIVDPYIAVITTQPVIPVPDLTNFSINFDTLTEVIASTTITDGDVLNVKERTTGNGGGGIWDVVLASSVTPNTFEIVQCVGDASLALVLRINGIVKVRQLGAISGAVTNATDEIVQAIVLSGVADIPDGSSFLITAEAVDLRKLTGLGTVVLTTGLTITASSLMDRGTIAQRYAMEVENTNSLGVTQALAMHDGDLYRSQQGTVAAGGNYDFDSTVLITQLTFPSPLSSRTTIDYASNTGAIEENFQVEVKGLGHGDGIAFRDDGTTLWMYAHASAPAGSGDPDADAIGYVRFPWLGESTALEPAGAEYFRDLRGVTNGNFGLSVDGKWLLFVQRDVTTTKITNGETDVTTLRVVVHDRALVEAAVDPTTVDPFSKFVVRLEPEQDTSYAESGITSDGKYLYVNVSGARVVGKTMIYVYTMDGVFVKSIMTSGIRSEDLEVYRLGDSGFLPIFHESEGLTFHEDKLFVASRYTFAIGGDVVSFQGENFVYINENDDSGNTPTNVGFWAPTDAATTAGAYNAGTTYTRGTALVHHYISAYITAGTYGSEEFSVDIDPYAKASVGHSVSGTQASRGDYSVCFDALNTRLLPAMFTARTNGEFYIYDAEKLISGDHTVSDGLKFVVNDDDLRMQRADGLGTSGAVILQDSGAVEFFTGSSSRGGRVTGSGIISDGYIRNNTDNTHSFGLASHRSTVVYSATGTINTSDEREKTELLELDDIEKAVALEIKSNIRKFKFNDAVEKKGDKARIHVGVGVQTVQKIFEKHGLEPTEYALFCYDEWDDIYERQPAVINKDGAVVIESYEKLTMKAGNRYGIRYEELLCFIVSAL